MALTDQITSLATRIASECKSIRTTVAGKANSTHTHAAADVTSGTLSPARLPLVTSAPYTATYAASMASSGWTVDSTLGNKVRLTATGNVVVNAPTSPGDGQMVLLMVLASGAARTITFSGITLTTGLASSYAVTSGKTAYLGLIYNGAWDLITQTQEV